MRAVYSLSSYVGLLNFVPPLNDYTDRPDQGRDFVLGSTGVAVNLLC